MSDSAFTQYVLCQLHAAKTAALDETAALNGKPMNTFSIYAGESVELENFFSRLALDIIGKAVFNYDFDSLTHDDPVIKVGCLTT